jgi:opacity protein-like surface antigen
LGTGFGIRGGLISNYQVGGPAPSIPVPKKMTMLGVHSAFSTIPAIVLEGSLEYNWKMENYTDPTYGPYKMRVNDFSANGFAKFRVPLSTLKPFVGAGIGLHRLIYSFSNSSGTVPVPDDVTRPAFHALVGVAVTPPLMPLELFGEYRWTWVNTPDKKTKFPTLLAGMTFKL